MIADWLFVDAEAIFIYLWTRGCRNLLCGFAFIFCSIFVTKLNIFVPTCEWSLPVQ